MTTLRKILKSLTSGTLVFMILLSIAVSACTPKKSESADTETNTSEEHPTDGGEHPTSDSTATASDSTATDSEHPTDAEHPTDEK